MYGATIQKITISIYPTGLVAVFSCNSKLFFKKFFFSPELPNN